MTRRAAALLALVLSTAGCSGRDGDATRVTVFAAASLTTAFTEEAEAYEKAHEGTDVVLSFAGSQSLVAQIQQGAPADVLATADEATMATVAGKLAERPDVFAHNQLAIVTAPGNPLHLTSLRDLELRGVKVVLAGETVPVGKAAKQVLDEAGLTVHPVSFEDSVAGVLGKVRLGEADAGIAYVTDVGDGVDGTPLAGTTTDLCIGSVTAKGEGFVEFVHGTEGRAILTSHRFQ